MGKERNKRSEFRTNQNDPKFTLKDFLSKDQIEKLKLLFPAQGEKPLNKGAGNFPQYSNQVSFPQQKANLLNNKKLSQGQGNNTTLNKPGVPLSNGENVFERPAEVEVKNPKPITSFTTEEYPQNAIASALTVYNKEYEAEKVRWINILEKALLEKGGLWDQELEGLKIQNQLKNVKAFENALKEVAYSRSQEIEITPSNFQTKTCWYLKSEREKAVRERLKSKKCVTLYQLENPSKEKGGKDNVVFDPTPQPLNVQEKTTISENKAFSRTLEIKTPLKTTNEHLLYVFENFKRKYPLSEKAVIIKTPLPQTKSLDSLWFSLDVLHFIEAFEPKAKDGIFLHQWELLMAYLNGARNFVLTSSTGSGKSLCFWTWVIDNLYRNPDHTALVCFPTQALVWSQADRLARASDSDSLKGDNEEYYSGLLKIGRQKIGWTVWKGGGFGYTIDKKMKEHERTPEFLNAQIRISTLDKADWSLIAEHPEFAKRLKYIIVLDEAHCYDGVFGANVQYFLKRVQIAKEYWGTPAPQIFLSTATLSESSNFASQLTGIDAKHFHFQSDSTKQEVFSVSLEEAKDFLKNPLKNGLIRVVFFIDSLLESADSLRIQLDDKILGEEINAIYFSESKIESRLLKLEMDSRTSGKRESIIYDADLPPEERRYVEGQFNRNKIKGANLIATSALELGVDIENIDICLINNVPARKVELLQRIGRVGRRVGKPGIVILRLGHNALDRLIAQNPVEAFKAKGLKTVPIPENVELQKFKNIVASYKECLKSFSSKNDPPKKFLDLQKKYFGLCKSYYEVCNEIIVKYPGLVDTKDQFWYLKGFRSNLSQGKIPLKEDKDFQEVARIDELSIFRDAHPEAVYLDSHCKRWRVKKYITNWWAKNLNSSGINAVEFANSIRAVIVTPEKEMKFTRGVWKDSFNFIRTTNLKSLSESTSNFKCGVWEFQRKFDGYIETDLTTKGKKRVTLFEVSKRFELSKSLDEDFPYLHPFSYITHGWSVLLSQDQVLDIILTDEALIALVESILSSFFSEVINCSSTDLIVKIDPKINHLIVLDATPGGSGLSFALIKHGLMQSALKKAIQIMEGFLRNEHYSSGIFKNYIGALSNEPCEVSPEILISVYRILMESLKQ